VKTIRPWAGSRCALVLGAVLALGAPRLARADDGAPAPAPASEARRGPDARPRLVVLVSVDQLRADFFERLGARLARYGTHGFRRLLAEGASFTDCRYRHSGTFTGPGHATISTGADPRVHGIVGNEWWDRSAKDGAGAKVYCVADPDAVLFGAPGTASGGGEKVSSRNLRVDTIGDAMKAGLPGAPRVIGLSLKDRSAILLAGKRADAAFWIDPQAGGFVTNQGYLAWSEGAPEDREAMRRAVEGRLKAYDAQRLPSFFVPWTPDPRAGAGYEEALPDDRPEEGKGGTFPHGAERPQERLAALELSPSGNDLLVDFLETMIPLGSVRDAGTRAPDEARLALGARDGVTDLLCLSFSSTDKIGHRYGADSQEAADAFVRLDATIERLLRLLDERVGPGRWWLALTADHGVAPLPEYAARVGLDAGRVTAKDLREALAPELGETPFAGVTEGNVYLRGVKPGDLPREMNGDSLGTRNGRAAMLAEGLLRLPGVFRAYTRAQLLEGRVPDDPQGRGALASFDPVRSGDVVVQLRPYWTWGGPVPGTTHGQPWAYDQRVPLVILAHGMKAGSRPERAAVNDLVATLSALLHVQPPAGCDGRILSEALDLDAWRASMPWK